MDNVFQKMADKDNPQSQPTPGATPQPQATPQAQPQPSQSGNVFEQMNQADKQQNPPDSVVTAAQNKALTENSEAARELKSKQDAGGHGLLARAWDWVNQPLFDNVLPEGVKTADIIKGAAFEKMYNEAYIPGVNDFNTKAATHLDTVEKMQAGLGPKEKDGYVKKNIRQFLVDHANGIDQMANAANTGIAGATRDTADMATGFSSPLSVGTLGLNKAGRAGKILAPLVGTAFGLQGMGQVGEGAKDLLRTTTWENLKKGYVDPDAVQKVLGGAGQAALAGTAAVHGASDVVDFAKEKSTPQIRNIGGQDVPVRAENTTAQMVQKAVPAEVNDAAARNTADAVQKGVGDIVGEAVGSDADTAINQKDRLGIRAHANDLKTKATTAMDELNRLSDGMYNDARDMADKSRYDQTTEGRDKFMVGQALMRDVEEQYRGDMTAKGHDIDEMRANYRKGTALEKIAKRVETATNARTGNPGEFDVSGKKLVKAIDDLRKIAGDSNDPSHSKNLFDRAGLTEDHINTLAELADTLREQQEQPKFGTLAKMGAKALALAAAGKGVGLGGALEAITGESLAEHIGSKAMGKLFGDALTDVTTAKQLNAAIKGGPTAMSNWDKFKETATRLWQEERGQMEVPGTGTMGTGAAVGRAKEPVRISPRTDGTEGYDVTHPDGVSKMRLVQEDDGQGGKRLRQTGIYAAENPGAGQEMMDTLIDRAKKNPSISEVVSDYPDRRSEANEGHWQKLGRRGHDVRTRASLENGQPALTKEGTPGHEYYVPTKGDATVSSSADAYNAARGKQPITSVTPEAHPSGQAIADSYANMKHDPRNPRVAASYKALRNEVDAQWEHAQKSGFKLEPWTKEGQPYANSKEMKADVDRNHHLYFFRGGDIPADHPLAAVDPKTGLTFNDKFRAVHDLYGHATGGYEFGPKGEEAAYKTHAQMFSPEAIPALTSETRGQNNWVNFGLHMRNAEGDLLQKGEPGYLPATARPYAEQKAGILPQKFQSGVVSNLIDKYGTTSDVLKAGFILPEGDMIPLTGEHDHMLGGKTTEDTREKFIRDTGTIRSRYRMSRAGEEQVFSLPSEITEDQARQIRASAGKLRNGRIVLETVDGNKHQSLDFPTGAKAQSALEGLVKIKPDVEESTGTDASASEIATRRPTSTKATPTNASGQYADMAGVKEASRLSPSADGKIGYAEKLARTVSKYTGLDFTDEELQNPEAVMEKFINRMTDNLVSLHDAMPEPMRQIARQWYGTANKLAHTLAEKHGVTPEQSAGVIAALSPQNAWDNNVAIADRLIDAYKNRQNFKYSPKMEAQVAKIKQGQLSRSALGILKDIHGKTLAQIANDPMPPKFQKLWGDEAVGKWKNVVAAKQAMWVRLYDEAHNSPQNPMFHPSGDIVGMSPTNRSWIGLDHIAKSIRIINDGSVESINNVMGDGNKIRNFYNNIIHPDSPNGHTTIDTHAVGAAHFQPFSGDNAEVVHNFDSTTKGVAGPPKNAATGMRGTYPLYAEAYQRAAKKLGIQPRELQSITWEGIRSLMGDEKKTPELKSFTHDTWEKVQNKELTPQQARDLIIEKAGGFSKPAWMSEDQWDEAMGTGFNPEEFAHHE